MTADAERLAAEIEAAWKEHSTGFSWPSEEAEYGEYRAFGAGYTLAAIERDAEKERAEKAELSARRSEARYGQAAGERRLMQERWSEMRAELDALRARIEAVKVWRSWYATGEAPSPSEWRDLDRRLAGDQPEGVSS